MPSRAYTSFLRWMACWFSLLEGQSVNALSGLYLISTVSTQSWLYDIGSVSMPSRAYTSFLRTCSHDVDANNTMGVNALSGLYLISTGRNLIARTGWRKGVNALSGLYLISTDTNLISLLKQVISVSMPSRAYTSFLRYPFKNLGFMRFPEPVFAGIYQNILTTAVFRAC